MGNNEARSIFDTKMAEKLKFAWIEPELGNVIQWMVADLDGPKTSCVGMFNCLYTLISTGTGTRADKKKQIRQLLANLAVKLLFN